MAGYLRTTLVAGCAAVLLGGLLGLATVGGVRTRPGPAVPLYPRAMPAVDAGSSAAAPDCAGCTGYDAGYRWAGLHHVAETDRCFGADWARQRGCLAYVAGGRAD